MSNGMISTSSMRSEQDLARAVCRIADHNGVRYITISSPFPISTLDVLTYSYNKIIQFLKLRLFLELIILSLI